MSSSMSLRMELAGCYPVPTGALSAKFQEMLFSVGIKWIAGGKRVQYTGYKYLAVRHGRIYTRYNPVFADTIDNKTVQDAIAIVKRHQSND